MRTRNKWLERRNSVAGIWGQEVANLMLPDHGVSEREADEIRSVAIKIQDYPKARRMVNNAIVTRLLDQTKKQSKDKLRKATKSDWNKVYHRACDDEEIPLAVLVKLGFQIGEFGLLTEGGPELQENILVEKDTLANRTFLINNDSPFIEKSDVPGQYIDLTDFQFLEAAVQESSGSSQKSSRFKKRKNPPVLRPKLLPSKKRRRLQEEVEVVNSADDGEEEDEDTAVGKERHAVCDCEPQVSTHWKHLTEGPMLSRRQAFDLALEASKMKVCTGHLRLVGKKIGLKGTISDEGIEQQLAELTEFSSLHRAQRKRPAWFVEEALPVADLGSKPRLEKYSVPRNRPSPVPPVAPECGCAPELTEKWKKSCAAKGVNEIEGFRLLKESKGLSRCQWHDIQLMALLGFKKEQVSTLQIPLFMLGRRAPVAEAEVDFPGLFIETQESINFRSTYQAHESYSETLSRDTNSSSVAALDNAPEKEQSALPVDLEHPLTRQDVATMIEGYLKDKVSKEKSGPYASTSWGTCSVGSFCTHPPPRLWLEALASVTKVPLIEGLYRYLAFAYKYDERHFCVKHAGKICDLLHLADTSSISVRWSRVLSLWENRCPRDLKILVEAKIPEGWFVQDFVFD